MNLLKKNKHVWIIIIYGILYMIAFICLERSNMEPHIIHSIVDDHIPFCEYFIIPYVMWYGFIAVTLWYFAFKCKGCGRRIRVPRGKGKVEITCPLCGKKIIRHT